MPDWRAPTTNFREDAAQGAVRVVFSGLLGDPDCRRRVGSGVQILVGVLLLVFGYRIGPDHCRLVFFGVKTQGKLVRISGAAFSSGWFLQAQSISIYQRPWLS